MLTWSDPGVRSGVLLWGPAGVLLTCPTVNIRGLDFGIRRDPSLSPNC